MGTAVEGVPGKWIQERIKSMLNTTQEAPSLMDIQDRHSQPHHEVQAQLLDLCNSQAKATSRVRYTSPPNNSRPIEEQPSEAKASPTKSKPQGE
ncbi:hypothetical protein NP233_g8782 [Leucocoprinus birnbaumii]|uniref:Uncharacterized protein n=1 Tax=Leucocoprinus birnbaumii TaxID=56174 RepID=A0AAD5VLR6_9AGAR|nr:hypothetical protein NP233_g8782 [Leucocoprinus birnbaumii]